MNLATSYLGLPLRNPFIVGSSPFCDTTATARELEAAGAAALVMRSLFEEQLEEPAANLAAGGARHAGLPDLAAYQFSPHAYLRQLEQLKAAVKIPVIASLNGHRSGNWIAFGPELERAGADAIELNFYQVVTDPAIAADQIETEMLEAVGTLVELVGIPVAAKLSPFHTSVAQLAVALELAGAAGVVIFNRFQQPDINIDAINAETVLHLSDPSELLLRLRWLAILAPQLRCSLAATGGIHQADGAIKALLAGADALQIVSVLLERGPAAMHDLLTGVEKWMREHHFRTVDQFRGRLDLHRCPDSSAFERANYIRTLQGFRGVKST